MPGIVRQPYFPKVRALKSLDWLAASSGLFMLVTFVAAALAVGSVLQSLLANPARVTVVGEWRDAKRPAVQVTEILDAFNRQPEAAASQDRDPSRPLWVRIELPATFSAAERTVEFRLFRPDKARFWLSDARSGGTFSKLPEGAIAVDKGGFSVQIPAHATNVVLVGEIQSVFPWKPKTFLWSRDSYEDSTFSFERQGGALVGSLLILAVFSGIVAILNRDFTFLLFSGWVIASIRIAAINGGWDKTWMGIELDDSSYLLVLRVTMAAYGFLTIAIFRSLFISANAPSVSRLYFAAVQISFVVLTLLIPVLSHTAFLKTFWLLSALSLLSTAAFLAKQIVVAPTRVAAWYLASWATIVAGMASEIGFQAGVNQIPTWINSQTAAIVSALMMGVALADKLKTEREARISAQAKSLRYLKKYEENYNSMPIGLFGLAGDGSIRIHNPAFSAMFEQSNPGDDLRGHIDRFLGDGAFDRIRDVSSEVHQDLELCLSDSLGKDRWFLVRASSKDSSIEGSIQDVTVRKLAERRLQHLVDHDSLTGVLNRRGIDTAFQAIAEHLKTGTNCAVAYVDLDRFKLINDLHGHAVGDNLLQQAASRVLKCVRRSDLVGRLGDSFIVLFPDCAEIAVSRLTERIRAAVGDESFAIDGRGLNMTVSVGVVSMDDTMSAVDAIAAADRACAEAKSRGRNCVVRLTEQDTTLQSHLEELRVVADLQQRIPTDKYFLEFQPIVALRSAMSSLSYEVLIRMRGDDGRVIPPGKFIGAAERNGLMSQIDRWVLRQTLEWLDNHPEHRDRVSFSTINISGASLNDTRFVDDAFAMIADHPLAMPKLCFEITESVALHDLGSTRRFVDRVRMYGSKLALDDFGAGYTSFNYLKEIPADFIKIDGSFVKDINRNPANYAITRTIVDLTHELGMRSIAEWAETPDTIASLCDLGVDFGQGFGLVRPIAPELVAASSSGGALVRDPQVIELLADRARMPLPIQTREPFRSR
jgi:diguanylate cyclase (GGDEF)-like protein